MEDKMKNWIVLSLLFVGLTAFMPGVEQGDEDVVGVWLNGQKTAHINIFKAGTYYYGKIVWLETPNDKDGNPRKDKNNPDESLQSKPLMNLLILKGFTYDGNHKWSDGTIYDPKEGKTYSCKMWFEDGDLDNLKMRGFVGISMIGRTDTWTRVKE